MKSRERVLKTINFQEPDRIPLDIGGAAGCGINVIAYNNLLEYLGMSLPKEENLSHNQIARVDEAVFKKLGVDVRPVTVKDPSSYKRTLHEDERYTWFWDEWGRKMSRPKVGGYYFDTTEFPLEKKDFEDLDWPDPTDETRFTGLKEQAHDILDTIDAALVSPKAPATGFYQFGAYLHNYTRWFLMLAGEPAKAEKFMDRLLDWKIRFWEAYLSHLDGNVDIVCENDDLGTQNGTIMSREMFRKYFKPRQAKLYSAIKKKADVKIFLHSCGSVYDFIPDLIEAGVDILNPIQVNAAQMDTKRLKKEFGSDLVFWGGGVDTQKILPHGTPQDVKEEVKRRIDDLAPGGGFVFAAVHHIQADVPPENIVAMLEALEQYGKY